MPVIPLWAVAMFFLLTTLVFFRTQIFGSAYFWEDFAEYVYPAQSFAARALRAGEIPFWNPYTLSGLPFLADVAVGFFYPPNWLLALFVKDGKLPVLALELVIIAHFWLAQCTMYLLARQFKVSSLGSLIAAVSYGFSSILVCHTFHPMMVAHFAWFPLAFLYFRRAISEQRIVFSLLSGLVLGAMMLSGHPQTTLYLVLFLFFVTLWTAIAKIVNDHASITTILRLGVLAALPIVIAAGLFAVQLLHSQEFSAYSERNALTLEKASIGSMQLKQVFTAAVPKLFGASDAQTSSGAAKGTPFFLEGSEYYAYWETAFYFGIPALLLGLIGLSATVRSREHDNVGGLILFTSVFAVLFALGNNGFLFPAMFHLPFFDRFRVPSRMVMLLPPGFTLLAGIGFDKLLHNGQRLTRSTLAVVGVVILIAIIAASGSLSNVPTNAEGSANAIAQAIQGFGITALVMAFAAGALILLLLRNTLSPTLIGIALLLLTVIDLNIANSSFNTGRTNPEAMYSMDSGLQTQLQIQPPGSIFRVRTRERGITAMPRNQGLMSPVMMYDGYMPLLPERRVPPTHSASVTYDLLAIRYEIAIDPAQGGAYFAERRTAFPHARMLYKALQTNPEQAKAVATSGNVDFANEVILETSLPLVLPNVSAATVQHNVQCVAYSANEIEYKISSAQNGILVVSEVWYPAWKATLDGNSVDVLRADYSLRGIAVPAGDHTVRLFYASSAFRAGAWISILTLVLTLGVLGFVAMRRNGEGGA